MISRLCLALLTKRWFVLAQARKLYEQSTKDRVCCGKVRVAELIKAALHRQIKKAVLEMLMHRISSLYVSTSGQPRDNV